MKKLITVFAAAITLIACEENSSIERNVDPLSCIDSSSEPGRLGRPVKIGKSSAAFPAWYDNKDGSFEQVISMFDCRSGDILIASVGSLNTKSSAKAQQVVSYMQNNPELRSFEQLSEYALSKSTGEAFSTEMNNIPEPVDCICRALYSQ